MWIIFIVVTAVLSLNLECTLAQCSNMDATTSTDRKTTDGSYMTYVGETNSTHIKCQFSCTGTCEKEYLYWRKDNNDVYAKWWTNGGTTGPLKGYEDRVSENIYENETDWIFAIEWNSTLWEDLPFGSNSTSWECYMQLTSCGTLADSTDIEYFKLPEVSSYVDDELLLEDNCDEVRKNSNGTLNCTVISRPESRIYAQLGDIHYTKTPSCSPYSVHESICSLEVNGVDFREEFFCYAEYVSPESGYLEQFDDRCPLPLTPTPTPPGLEAWEIFLIVLGCFLMAYIIGTCVYTHVCYCCRHAKSWERFRDRVYDDYGACGCCDNRSNKGNAYACE